MPKAMAEYVNTYGWHFNKKTCEFAVSLMRRKDVNTQQSMPVVMMSKESVDAMLKAHGVMLNNNKLYDYVFVANMARADYMQSSITDERHLALFVKDYIDDDDASDEVTFRRWLATLVANRQYVEWEDML